MHGQEENALLNISIPCCSLIRSRKGHRALKHLIISCSLSLQLKRTIAVGQGGLFQEGAMPHSWEQAVEEVRGGMPSLCTCAHIGTHKHTRTHSCSPVGKHGGDQALGST